MRIFAYEFVTGGGWYDVDPTQPPGGTLLAEGAAMLAAVASDFAELPDFTVSCLQDARIPRLPLPPAVDVITVATQAEAVLGFTGSIKDADFVLLIAPEMDGHLWRKTRFVEQFARPLLSQASDVVANYSDKWRLYQGFGSGNSTGPPTPTPTPKTIRLTRGVWREYDLEYPLVAKPVDGCGSIGVQLLNSRADMIDWSEFSGDALLQEYCEGMAASVAMLSGPGYVHSLPACRQNLSKDGRFRYLGGECRLPEPLDDRARSLAAGALGSISQGWVGVDMVLGEAQDGSQDYVIEVNPRLTTSYVGLRVLSQTNLAQAMLDVAQGREPHLAWKPGRVRWSADGAVEYFEP